MCRVREREGGKSAMACITKYPMVLYWVSKRRQFLCVCNLCLQCCWIVEWMQTFASDQKRDAEDEEEFCEWKSKFNKHRQTYQFNWIKFNNYSWWCYQKEFPFFLPATFSLYSPLYSHIYIQRVHKCGAIWVKIVLSPGYWKLYRILVESISFISPFTDWRKEKTIKKYVSSFIVIRNVFWGEQDGMVAVLSWWWWGIYLSDISDTICIFKWLFHSLSLLSITTRFIHSSCHFNPHLIDHQIGRVLGMKLNFQWCYIIMIEIL